MRVKINDLVPGCIISEDVYKKGTSPLIKKNTTITEKHITILKLFFIQDVPVEAKLTDGRIFSPSEIITEADSIHNHKESVQPSANFIINYKEAVADYKKLFVKWQGGTKIDAYGIRQLLLKIISEKPEPEILLHLHRQSTVTDYNYHHAIARAVLSYMIGERLDLQEKDLVQLGISALMADCGMSKVSSTILLNKNLMKGQFKEIHDHPRYGFSMLEGVTGVSEQARLGVLQHHERENGSGYPNKIKGDRIHQFAKIIAAADMYHAMTCERPYQKRQPPYKVLEIIGKECFGLLDPLVIDKIKSLLINLKIGEKVRLTNGEEGVIVFLQSNEPTRPILRMLTSNELFKLSDATSLFIDSKVD
ncbi:HD-GYP domain-containing protein [Bacillus sp. H-16]|uniref:HD-GYP domain-containing protein n=1 Tax=Alteribacter salitolerans TaxID=2912333 RepID=UPI00196417E8|nr:HD-GYP domain-containing protein [Alteribacter salitolerans]MBM7095355.1 HD-GYP domain-containing protein [Alteribacter salitolerans]